MKALTYLAPNMFPVYRAVIDHLSRELGIAIQLQTGAADYHDVGEADLHFICGLPYVQRTPALEALAAPVLQDERCQQKPIYFSDVIVHRESPYQTFADLRGCAWAYNESESQSGYGITRYTLLRRGETRGFFSRVIEAGFHQKAIRMVYRREVDAAAIDSQVLAVELCQHPRLAEKLRVIDTFGPSTIQPLTAARHLPSDLKQAIQTLMTGIHHDSQVKALLDTGFIDHFAPVTDGDYDDIRMMLDACQAANFMILR